MSNTYTVWGMSGATRLAMNQHHMAGVLGLRGGLGETRAWPPVEAPPGSYDVTVGPGGTTRREPLEGAENVAVLDVQEALHLRGYKGGDGRPLTLDGRWGANSKAAFAAFCNTEKRKAYEALLEEGTALPPTVSLEQAGIAARMTASDSYWDNVKFRTSAGYGSTEIPLAFGLVREKLFRGARPATLPGAAPPPSRRSPAPPAPDTRTPPRLVEEEKKEETDWTTWALAGTGVVLAGVAIWAIFRKKRK